MICNETGCETTGLLCSNAPVLATQGIFLYALSFLNFYFMLIKDIASISQSTTMIPHMMIILVSVVCFVLGTQRFLSIRKSIRYYPDRLVIHSVFGNSEILYHNIDKFVCDKQVYYLGKQPLFTTVAVTLYNTKGKVAAVLDCHEYVGMLEKMIRLAKAQQ